MKLARNPTTYPHHRNPTWTMTETTKNSEHSRSIEGMEHKTGIDLVCPLYPLLWVHAKDAANYNVARCDPSDTTTNGRHTLG